MSARSRRALSLLATALALVSTWFFFDAGQAIAQQAGVQPPAAASTTAAPASSAVPEKSTGAPDAMDAPTAPTPPSASLPLPLPLPEQPATALAPSDEISLEEWNRADWQLLQPEVSLFELDGYFRLRGDTLRKLDFGNQARWERVPRYLAVGEDDANFTSTNMRLRLEPRINVSDRIQVVTLIDVFDNLVLGSTPDSLATIPSDGTPTDLLSRSQLPPRSGINAVTDSIVVKRAYARMTALNEQVELRFGRMADHWGTGMLANSGDCLDCDFTSAVDRVAVTFRAAGHLFAPMFDWVSNGPVALPYGGLGEQALDAFRWDDAVQYALRIAREDHPEDIANAVLRGEVIVNYGLHNAFRVQARDLPEAYYAGGYNPAIPYPDASATSGESADPRLNDQRRNALLYVGDAYGHLYWGNLELQTEAAVEAGSFRDHLVDTSANTTRKTTVLKVGAAADVRYKFDGDYAGTALSLKVGGATGDHGPKQDRRGMGALDQADNERGASVDGSYDFDLENFQFNPSYHVDLLLFRRIIGTVTDAWYARPEVSYQFDERLSGRLAAIYAQAITVASTPGRKRPLGLEIDAELTYGLGQNAAAQGFKAALAGGMLFPFAAFKNLDTDEDPSFAWTMQGRLYITF